MSRNERTEFQKFANASRSTGAPLFDDEQTILRARPVVPLEQIDKKVKLKSRWVIAVAFVVSMLLGGVSGLVSGYLKLKEVSELRVAEGETQPVVEEPPASTLPGEPGEESNASPV